MTSTLTALTRAVGPPDYLGTFQPGICDAQGPGSVRRAYWGGLQVEFVHNPGRTGAPPGTTSDDYLLDYSNDNRAGWLQDKTETFHPSKQRTISLAGGLALGAKPPLSGTTAQVRPGEARHARLHLRAG